MSRDFFRLRNGSRDEEVMNRKGEAIAMMGQAPVTKSRKSEGNRARDGGGKSKKEVLSQRARNYTTLDYIIRYPSTSLAHYDQDQRSLHNCYCRLQIYWQF